MNPAGLAQFHQETNRQNKAGRYSQERRPNLINEIRMVPVMKIFLQVVSYLTNVCLNIRVQQRELYTLRWVFLTNRLPVLGSLSYRY